MKVGAWLRHRVGRRGASLLFFGILDTCQAGALMLVPGDATQGAGVMTFSDEIWAGAWGAAAVLCFVTAFTTTGRDAAGFAAAIAIKMLWGTAFIVEWIQGAPYLIVAVGLTWWLFAAHVIIVAGWPEPISPQESP